MSSAETFPRELWLAIFDLFIEQSISPDEMCTSNNFHEMLLRLRMPWDYGIPKEPPSLLDIRLVCRAFNALVDAHLHTSPPYFAMTGIDEPVPSGTRALYIHSAADVAPSLQRLLTEPEKAQCIVLLDISGSRAPDYPWDTPIHFDLLCDVAQSLPSVRCLSFCLHHGIIQYQSGLQVQVYGTYSNSDPPRFWARLNEAFPRLTCLVLRGGLLSPSGETVIFKELEILDMDFLSPEPTVYFPSLLYVAFGSMSASKIRRFTAWPQLYSLELREIDQGVTLDRSLFPRLLSLSIPSIRVYNLAPPPVGHLLKHLHIQVGIFVKRGKAPILTKNEELRWLRLTMSRIPVRETISFVFQKEGLSSINGMRLEYDGAELARMGFTMRQLPRWGDKVSVGVIMERIGEFRPVELQEPSLAQPTPSRKGLRAGWDKLRDFAGNQE